MFEAKQVRQQVNLANTCISRKLKIKVRSAPVKNALEVDAADGTALWKPGGKVLVKT